MADQTIHPELVNLAESMDAKELAEIGAEVLDIVRRGHIPGDDVHNAEPLGLQLVQIIHVL